jgi:hypothetical protein
VWPPHTSMAKLGQFSRLVEDDEARQADSRNCKFASERTILHTLSSTTLTSARLNREYVRSIMSYRLRKRICPRYFNGYSAFHRTQRSGGSIPAQGNKNPQHAFIQRGSKAADPMSKDYGMLKSFRCKNKDHKAKFIISFNQFLLLCY